MPPSGNRKPRHVCPKCLELHHAVEYMDKLIMFSSIVLMCSRCGFEMDARDYRKEHGLPPRLIVTGKHNQFIHVLDCVV